jgi:hypothetical protein
VKTREAAMTTQLADKTARIRELNDELRTTFLQRHGRVLITAGVDALPLEVKRRVVAGVKSFDQFDRENDPRQEHDFGSFDIEGQTFFWKIDYYTPKLDGGSEDPSDPTMTMRVLTIMLADEY